MATSTDKVPNTSATAASSGSDLNGQAIKAACETLLARLRPVAAQMLGGEADDVRVRRRCGVPRATPTRSHCRSPKSCRRPTTRASACRHRLLPHAGPLGSEQAGKGHPFYYFAFGAAVAEVEVCGTPACTVARVDILHDVGESLNEVIDRGQIEGGFVQGMGWLTCEELRWNAQGRLLTDAPSTYKIPTVGDVPEDFRVDLYRRTKATGTT
jgi:xanthine dehydrogenase large subunit